MAAELERAYKRIVNAWCLYDWGSSAFSTTVEAAVLPVYFEQVVAAGLAGNLATVYWGYTNSAALLIAALLAPILGSIADYTGGKKRLLAIFAAIGIMATALMVLINSGDWVLALVLFLLGSVGLGASYVFYDALLPHVARADDIDYVSSKGYALGYLGGGILLAVNIVMIQVLFKGSTGYPSRPPTPPASARASTRWRPAFAAWARRSARSASIASCSSSWSPSGYTTTASARSSKWRPSTAPRSASG